MSSHLHTSSISICIFQFVFVFSSRPILPSNFFYHFSYRISCPGFHLTFPSLITSCAITWYPPLARSVPSHPPPPPAPAPAPPELTAVFPLGDARPAWAQLQVRKDWKNSTIKRKHILWRHSIVKMPQSHHKK